MGAKKRATPLTMAAIGAGDAALRNVPALLPEKLELEPLDQSAGFRKYVAGETSGGFDAFVGLGTAESSDVAAQKAARLRRVSADLCDALYGDLEARASIIPIASFSDYYCPFCPAQTKRLAGMTEDMQDQVAVAWHAPPLPGDSANLAAQAALVAT